MLSSVFRHGLHRFASPLPLALTATRTQAYLASSSATPAAGALLSTSFCAACLCRRSFHSSSSAFSSSSSDNAPSRRPSSAASSGPVPPRPLDAETFTELGLDGPLSTHITTMGISSPTPIQQRVLPVLIRAQSKRIKRALLVQSSTGSGKSLSFLLPVLSDIIAFEQDRLKHRRSRTGIKVVIMCPTQELAMQTHAAVWKLLECTPSIQSDTSFIRLLLGGPNVDLQRTDLMTIIPSIVIATPKRLNQVLFPLYDTHGRGDRRRDVILNPIEDEGVAAAEDGEDLMLDSYDHEFEYQEQGRGESHRSPQYRAAEAVRALRAAQAEKMNIVRASKHDEDDDPDLDDGERDGIKTELLPEHHAVAYEAARFLHTPTRLAAERVRSPCKKILKELSYVIVDEVDAVLQPLISKPSPMQKENRANHPKPGQIALRGMTLLSPQLQFVGASATVNGQLTRLLWKLHPRMMKDPRILRINPRPEQVGETTYEMEQAEQEQQALLMESSMDESKQDEDDLRQRNENEEDNSIEPSDANIVPLASNSLSHRATSTLRHYDPYLGSSLISFAECPPNISHFYVVAPSQDAWRNKRHAEPFEQMQKEMPQKRKYEYSASAAERQKVHEHNMEVTRYYRRNAFIVDKLCSLSMLLSKFQPKCVVCVVDEDVYTLRNVEKMCNLVGIRSTLLYTHLASTSASVRAQFFDDINRGGVYDVLLIGKSSVRGLDLPMCDLVVTLQVIRNKQEYIHIAGRTGRLGREGSVITLLHPEEVARWTSLVEEMPLTLTSSKQILLPSDITPQMHTQFMRAYKQTKSDRVGELEELDKKMDEKLKKKVAPDSKLRLKLKHAKANQIEEL